MKKSTLGQFYTPSAISHAMSREVAKILPSCPAHVCDYAAGDGSLLKSVNDTWPNAKIYAYDIDPQNIELISQQFSDWNTLCTDSITFNDDRQYDIALGNPPFIKMAASKQSMQLLSKSFDVQNIRSGASIRSEVVFLAKYIDSLNDGGVLSIIVPESIINSEKLQFVRTKILNSFSKLSVLEIGLKKFDRAEVATYLITGQLSKGLCDQHLTVGKLTSEGSIDDLITVQKSDCIIRMDYKFIKNKQYINMIIKNTTQTIGDVSEPITRGRKTRLQLEEAMEPYFHTTSFKYLSDGKAVLSGDHDLHQSNSPTHLTQEGDILIPRIGRNCHKLQAVVVEGNAVLSDSVFRIRTNKENRNKVYDVLNSEAGIMWREIHSNGGCARVITIKNISCLPLICM
jgi:type I restriction enzyme M protein